MKRWWILIAAVVVLAMIALFIKTRGGDGASARNDDGPPVPGTGSAVPGTGSREPGGGSTAPGAASASGAGNGVSGTASGRPVPGTPSGGAGPAGTAPGTAGTAPGTTSGSEVAGSPPGVTGDTRVYTRDDGTVVRDHRGTGVEPIVAPAGRPPRPESDLMDPAVVAKVHDALRPMVLGCAATAPVGDMGPEAEVHVTLRVHIADGAVGVDEVFAVPRDIGDHAREIAECVHAKAANLAVATDHRALRDYDLSFPFRLRR